MKSFAGCAALIVSTAAADAEGMNLMGFMQGAQDILAGMTVSQSFPGKDGETQTLHKAFKFPSINGKANSGLKIKKFAFPQGMDTAALPMSMSFNHSFKLGDGGESHSVSFTPMTMSGLKVKKATEIKDPVTIFKTMGNVCGQVKVDKSQEQMAMTMMLGGKVGACATAGYKIPAGKSVLPPFMGGATVLKFKKTADGSDEPDMSEAADELKQVFKQMQPQINGVVKMLGPQIQELAKVALNTDEPKESVTLYALKGSECGQATIDKKFEEPAVSLLHLKEGTCSSQGFSTPDGTRTVRVPVIGSVTVAKFKKSKKLLLKKEAVVV